MGTAGRGESNSTEGYNRAVSVGTQDGGSEEAGGRKEVTGGVVAVSPLLSGMG